MTGAFKRGLLGAVTGGLESIKQIQSQNEFDRRLNLQQEAQAKRDARIAQSRADREAAKPIKLSASETQAERVAKSKGLERGTPEFESEVAGFLEGKGKTQVTIDSKGDTAEQKELGKIRGKRFAALQDQAEQAEETLNNISVARTIDVRSGALEPLKSSAAAIIESIGLNPNTVGLESATTAQQFTAIAGREVLSQMQQQKGPQTDADRRFIAKSISNLGATPDTNKFLFDVSEAVARRKIEQAEFHDDFLQESGGLRGATKAWNATKRDAPLLSPKVTNPETGRPMFFFEFEDKARETNPELDMNQIRDAWRDING